MLRLLPWQPAGPTSLMESVRVEDLMLLVDTLLEETNSGEDKVGSPGLQQPWKLQLNFR